MSQNVRYVRSRLVPNCCSNLVPHSNALLGTGTEIPSNQAEICHHSREVEAVATHDVICLQMSRWPPMRPRGICQIVNKKRPSECGAPADLETVAQHRSVRLSDREKRQSSTSHQGNVATRQDRSFVPSKRTDRGAGERSLAIGRRPLRALPGARDGNWNARTDQSRTIATGNTCASA